MNLSMSMSESESKRERENQSESKSQKSEIDSFKLGDIAVVITESNQPDKYHISCNDNTYVCNFTIRKYEYENYNKLMKTRIKTLFRQQHGES